MDLLSFSDDMESLLAYVPRFEADWGLYIFILGLVGLTSTFLISVWKSRSHQLDRQPINQAYKYLVDPRVVQEDGQEDGDEPIRIAGLLRQAALDEEIMIWGSEPSSAPVEWQAPILLEINRDYWRHHQIYPVGLMIDASEFPDTGCKTQRGSDPLNDPTECYWHLHVDMKQVRSKWTDIHEARL